MSILEGELAKPIPIGADVVEILRPAALRRGKDEWLLEKWHLGRERRH